MSIEAMKLALEALETAESFDIDADDGYYLKAITALRQAIEQAQQQEPDYYGLTSDHLWMSITKDHYNKLKPEFRMACYTSPQNNPQRQPLTDEHLLLLLSKIDEYAVRLPRGLRDFARAIEAAHGIKGEA